MIANNSQDANKLPVEQAGGRTPVAVMDLGTNTFHLLIAEGQMPHFKQIVHLHEAVKLGEGGINDGIIKPAPFERGITAMKLFRQHLDDTHTQQFTAIGTSAIRNARNGKDFIEQVQAQTGITIEMIDGDTEAQYIYQGVKASDCLSAQNALIMDIGGGSVEFIICNDKELLWKQSFEIGAARLMAQFHHHDPIDPASIEALQFYLDEKLPTLFAAVEKYGIDDLIGSSGAFETFACLAEFEKGTDLNLKETIKYSFELSELLAVTSRLINSTHQEREGNKNIIPVRVDMIVVTSVITRYIISKLGIKNVQMTTYSLKEGVLAGMMG